MGDPASWVSRIELEAHRRTSLILLFLGIASLLGSLWLSGYSFSQARLRSLFAAAACVVPGVLIFLGTFV